MRIPRLFCRLHISISKKGFVLVYILIRPKYGPIVMELNKYTTKSKMIQKILGSVLTYYLIETSHRIANGILWLAMYERIIIVLSKYLIIPLDVPSDDINKCRVQIWRSFRPNSSRFSSLLFLNLSYFFVD